MNWVYKAYAQEGTAFCKVSASGWIPDYNGVHYGPSNLTNVANNTASMFVEKESRPAFVSYV